MGANCSKLFLRPRHQSKRQSLSDLHQSVFENDLLLNKILTLALQKSEEDLHPPNLKLSISDARILRQVSRHWNLTVCSIFLQCREPLVHLSVSHDPSKTRQSLNLIRGLESSTLYSDPFGDDRFLLPPFSLSVCETGIKTDWDHVTLFEKLVVHFAGASSLLHLRVQDIFFLYPRLDYNVPWLPSHLQLSVLQNLTLECDATAHHHHLLDAFIQKILDQSPELQDVFFEEKPWDLEDSCKQLPEAVAISKFPATTLPHLTTLKVQSLNPDRLENLYILLSDLRLSLEHLILENREESGDGWLHLELVRFPVLPKLKTLTFMDFVSLAQLPEDTLYDVGAHFPVLEALNLSRHPFQRPFTDVLLGGWCSARFQYPSLKTLTFKLLEVESVQVLPTWVWNVILVIPMSRIRYHFPCVAHLSFVVAWRSLGSLGPLFMAIGGQLKSLRLEVGQGSNPAMRVVLGRDDWDALLLGTTPEIVRRFRRRWWERERWMVTCETLRYLQNLESLVLTGMPCPEAMLRSGMVSELTFRLGFLQMPALKRLTFGESFRVSSKCVSLWRKSGAGRTFHVDKRGGV